MELHRFYIHDRQPGLKDQGKAVARVLSTIGTHLIHAGFPPRGHDSRLGQDRDEFPVLFHEDNGPRATAISKE